MLPDPIKVPLKILGWVGIVCLTNSVSEANDLAMLMARLHTGNVDIITLRPSVLMFSLDLGEEATAETPPYRPSGTVAASKGQYKKSLSTVRTGDMTSRLGPQLSYG
ncbi:unnamed protein product [Coregonus sp. 'balchen']|nr:unnamed protein product [Coregonus sp. 'balchen']